MCSCWGGRWEPGANREANSQGRAFCIMGLRGSNPWVPTARLSCASVVLPNKMLALCCGGEGTVLWTNGQATDLHALHADVMLMLTDLTIIQVQFKVQS